MSLRELAAADAQSFLEDVDGGFSWPITVYPPNGATVQLKGFPNDVHQTIDPETGQAVAGRRASVAFSTRTLAAAGVELPHGVAETDRRPWVVAFNDINGNECTFRVVEALPDLSIGIVTCHLEAFRER